MVGWLDRSTVNGEEAIKLENFVMIEMGILNHRDTEDAEKKKIFSQLS
jgi:hypothetical protein